METEKIWNQTLNALQGKVSRQIFETWFQTANLESLQEGKVKIGVPNRFFGDWLKDHYQDVLVETLNGLLQRDDVEITFGVKMEKMQTSVKEKVLKEEEPLDRKNRVGATLNPKYTFHTFVVGSSNQFAHAATQAVAEKYLRNSLIFLIKEIFSFFPGVPLKKSSFVQLKEKVEKILMEGG